VLAGEFTVNCTEVAPFGIVTFAGAVANVGDDDRTVSVRSAAYGISILTVPIALPPAVFTGGETLIVVILGICSGSIAAIIAVCRVAPNCRGNGDEGRTIVDVVIGKFADRLFFGIVTVAGTVTNPPGVQSSFTFRSASGHGDFSAIVPVALRPTVSRGTEKAILSSSIAEIAPSGTVRISAAAAVVAGTGTPNVIRNTFAEENSRINVSSAGAPRNAGSVPSGTVQTADQPPK